jgi:hypothetical protein
MINKATVALLIAGMVVAACKEHKFESSYRMSDDFAMCVSLPKGSAYQRQNSSFDYEIGQMELAGKQLDVYIGYQPPYEGKSWTRGNEITDGFVVVGKVSSGGVEKLLLGNKRQPSRGPVFVMFTAPNLDSVESFLVAKDFVTDCHAKTAVRRNQQGL